MVRTPVGIGETGKIPGTEERIVDTHMDKVMIVKEAGGCPSPLRQARKWRWMEAW